MLKVISFGYLHLAGGELPPQAEITVDVRRVLRDPHIDPTLRELTGRDEPVRHKVIATVGAQHLAIGIAAEAEELRLQTRQPVTVAVGCAGGRHRSVVLADLIAEHWRRQGHEVVAEHRDIHRPVVQRDEAVGRGQ